MSVSGVGSVERRRVQEENEPVVTKSTAPAREASAEPPFDRVGSSPVLPSVEALSQGTAAFASLRNVAGSLDGLAAALALNHGVQSARSLTESERKLAADLEGAKPVLEKLARDLETLGRTAGPAAKDIFDIARGIWGLVNGVNHLTEGIAKLETGIGALTAIRGFFEVMNGARNLAKGLSELPKDIDKAKLAGPALDEVLRDVAKLDPHCRKLLVDAQEALGLLRSHPVQG